MLTKPITALRRQVRSEAGQSLAEYGLVLALIAVVCVAVVTALGLAIATNLGNITGAL